MKLEVLKNLSIFSAHCRYLYPSSCASVIQVGRRHKISQCCCLSAAGKECQQRSLFSPLNTCVCLVSAHFFVGYCDLFIGEAGGQKFFHPSVKIRDIVPACTDRGLSVLSLLSLKRNKEPMVRCLVSNKV